MKVVKLLTISSVLLFVPLVVNAQETPKVEVFGGYSYFNADRGSNLNGWNASGTFNLNHWFGIAADFSGHYGSDSFETAIPGVGSIRASGDGNLHLFTFGPVVSYNKSGRISPFAHSLFGVARASFNSDATFTVPGGSFAVGASQQDTAFAMALGGGVDVKLSKALAWRLVQADYVLTHFNNVNQNNARISTGLVFRF